MKILFIFIDGIGIGDDDTEINPFAKVNSKYFPRVKEDSFTPVKNNGILFPTDACLGIDGLPQSATGQTSLFTGVNAQAVLGRHLSGFPVPKLRTIIGESNIMKNLATKNFRVTFANAYNRAYFEREHKMISASSWMLVSSGVTINFIQELQMGRALFHDLTNQFLIEHDYDVPKRTPAESGKILGHITNEHDFTLFEYIMTDVIGHKRDMALAVEQANNLSEFLDGVFETIKFDETLIIISSDHGNIENVEIKTHTRNPVPTILWGSDILTFEPEINKITDLAPLIYRAFGIAG